jgi:hypothetical protein
MGGCGECHKRAVTGVDVEACASSAARGHLVWP